jgi:DnaJ-class molecular chaperone
MADDFYKILGVSRTADQAAIQKAYRELARKHHPDMNPDDKSAKEKFQKIQRAYDVLNDPKKREMYDRFGPDFERVAEGAGAGWRPGGAGWSGAGPGGGATFEDFDFSQVFGGQPGGGGFADIFSQFAGGAPRGARATPGARRGADVRHEVEIPFQTAVTGGEVQLMVRRPSGEVETISVKVPQGIEDGKKIRLRGQGEPAPRGGQAGDLIVVVRIRPHPHFERKGRNLEVRVPVTLAEAAMGAKIDVPTPKGTITLTVPPGSSSGRRLRVKGYGVSSAGAPAGDLFAELQIVLPPELDEDDKELIRQLDRRHPMSPRAELKW